ncbi:MAG: hypothetical protein HKN89_05010 [Eudoraea sp.]|nr:hypothetical protein [Eudoraea sp.]
MNPRTSWVHINSEQCYNLKLRNSDSDQVSLEAKLDGEYSEDLVISLEEDGNTLIITPRFRPNFRHPNDKLSAHKVVSISLDIAIPYYTNFKIYGTHTRVLAEGIFTHGMISLDDGSCDIKTEAEELEVITQSGDIRFTSKGANLSAESKFGQVGGDSISNGNGLVTLFTTSGNIELKQAD